MIINKSKLSPLFVNVIETFSEYTSSKASGCYNFNSNSILRAPRRNKSIKNRFLNKATKNKLLNKASGPQNNFNKSILWVKVYDNKLFSFLNTNTKNIFSILKPKTKINKTLTNSPALTQTLPITNAKVNNVKINKNIIKLINTNINNQEEITKINIKKYIKSISKYDPETVKYQNILYLFNKKGIKNSSIGITQIVFTLLESTFLSMSSLISKPIFVITPNKVVIQLFYYLNKFYSKDKLLNINNDKLQSLCLNLSKIYKKPVELELDRLHYPYYDSNILSNMIGLISNIVKLRFIIKKLFRIAKIKKTNKFINKSSIRPSYLSGFKLRIAGRLLTQRVIPRLTSKTIQRGTLARGKAHFINSARFTNKNKRGSFSITVVTGHKFV
jgi:hypothetical protein